MQEHVFRIRGRDRDRMMGVRVTEPDLSCVEQLTAAGHARGTVEGIPDERIPEPGHMDADLVRPSRMQQETEPCAAAAPGLYGEIGPRGLAVGRYAAFNDAARFSGNWYTDRSA